MSRKTPGHFNVLFVAGFGPIVQDITESHKFYLDTLGLSFEKDEEYLQMHRRQAVLTAPRLRQQHRGTQMAYPMQ